MLTLEFLQARYVYKKRGSGFRGFKGLEDTQGPVSQSMHKAEEGYKDGVPEATKICVS